MSPRWCRTDRLHGRVALVDRDRPRRDWDVVSVPSAHCRDEDDRRDDTAAAGNSGRGEPPPRLQHRGRGGGEETGGGGVMEGRSRRRQSARPTDGHVGSDTGSGSRHRGFACGTEGVLSTGTFPRDVSGCRGVAAATKTVQLVQGGFGGGGGVACRGGHAHGGGCGVGGDEGNAPQHGWECTSR